MEEDASSLEDARCPCTSSTTLDLSQNFVGGEGIRPLLQTIRVVHYFTRLDLSDHCADTQMVEDVVKYLDGVRSLQSLNFARNPRVTQNAGRALKDFVSRNVNVIDVCLDDTGVSGALRNVIRQQCEANAALRLLPGGLYEDKLQWQHQSRHRIGSSPQPTPMKRQVSSSSPRADTITAASSISRQGSANPAPNPPHTYYGGGGGAGGASSGAPPHMQPSWYGTLYGSDDGTDLLQLNAALINAASALLPPFYTTSPTAIPGEAVVVVPHHGASLPATPHRHLNNSTDPGCMPLPISPQSQPSPDPRCVIVAEDLDPLAHVFATALQRNGPTDGVEGVGEGGGLEFGGLQALYHAMYDAM